MDLESTLTELFRGLGITCHAWRKTTPTSHACRISGGQIPEIPTAPDANSEFWWLKADEAVCNISTVVGVSDREEIGRIAPELLDLNFLQPFGRISTLPMKDESLLVLCETMFALRTIDDDLQREVKSRVHHLVELRGAAYAVLRRAGKP